MWLELGPSSSSIILVLATLQDIISYINPNFFEMSDEYERILSLTELLSETLTTGHASIQSIILHTHCS